MEKSLGNLFSALLTGEINENEQYYTEDMIKGDDLSRLILGVLIAEKIITEEQYNQYKEEFIKMKNEQFRKEIQELHNKNTKKESVENERGNDSKM